MTLTPKIENKHLAVSDGFKQIGLTLKDARLSQGLTVRDISEQLRISVYFLTKLEAGAFDELPAPAYVIGFLRSYGRCVGLTPDTLVARYMAITGGKGSKPSYETPMSMRPPQRSAPAVASMLVLFALMTYGGWFWLKTNSLKGTDLVETDTETAALSLSLDHEATEHDAPSLDQPPKKDVAINNIANTADVPTAILSPEKILKPSGSALDTSKNQVAARPAVELAPTYKAALEPAEVGSSVLQTRISGQLKTDLKVGEAQTPSLPKSETSNRILSDGLVKTQTITARNSAAVDLLNSNKAVAKLRDPAKEITIRAVAASWVEIVRDNGEEVLAKLMQAGESYVVESDTRLFLSTGNAGGLTVAVGADDPLSIGDIGEIVRDMPLVINKLRKSL